MGQVIVIRIKQVKRDRLFAWLTLGWGSLMLALTMFMCWYYVQNHQQWWALLQFVLVVLNLWTCITVGRRIESLNKLVDLWRQSREQQHETPRRN